MLYVLDPADEHVVAMQAGGLSASQLARFLDDGARAAQPTSASAADVALRRGVELMSAGRHADAAAALRRAVDAGGAAWRERARALDLMVTALQNAGDLHGCADSALTLAPALAPDRPYVDIVLAGLSCTNGARAEPWSSAARATLEPQARAAMSLAAASRDDRFQLYEALIASADARGDDAGATLLARRWLSEIEAASPANDDERTALDVARVRAVTRLGTPERALPALAAAERAMPGNYTASARLASVALAARRWDEAIAASRRGLAMTSGAIGRAGLLVTEARAFMAKGDARAARPLLVEAMASARASAHEQTARAYLARVQHLLDELDKAPPPGKSGG